MPDGDGNSDGATASDTSGSDGAIGNMMPGGDGNLSLAPEERGIPGITRREPAAAGGMPGADMETKRGREHDMPAGSMGNGSIGLERGGGSGGGDDGFGGGGGRGGGGSSGNGAPQVRTCGTMDVNRRLLSASPEYARRRDEIEIEAARYERGEAGTQRTGSRWWCTWSGIPRCKMYPTPRSPARSRY